MDEINKVILSLEKLPQDIRDLSHHTLYGTIAPTSIPNINFSISDLPPIILNQTDLDFCTAEASSEANTKIQFATTSLVDYLNSKGMPSILASRSLLAVKYGLVASTTDYVNMAMSGTNAQINLKLLANLIYDNGDYFDPLYQMAKIKQVSGDWTSQGANIRDAAQALVTYGSLPKYSSPFTHRENKPTDRDRNQLANWTNWPANLDTIASQYKVDSYVSVDGPSDAFDNIRSALYMNYKNKTKSGVIFGLDWKPEWTSALNGIIDETLYQGGEGHAVYLTGQAIINNVTYIVVQNSWGKNVGNNGLYFFPRAIINAEFASGYGAFAFKDTSIKTLRYYNQIGVKVTDSIWQKTIAMIKNL